MRKRSSAAKRAAAVVGEDPPAEEEEKPKAQRGKKKAPAKPKDEKPDAPEPNSSGVYEDPPINDDAEEREKRKRQRAAELADANSDDLSMGDGYDRIIDTLFKLDVVEIYEECKAALSMRGQRASRADYGTLVDELDNAEEIASKAAELTANAHVQKATFEIDADIIESGMRDRARAHMEQEKADGTRTGNITQKDVDLYAKSYFADEWRALEVKREKVKQTVNRFDRLYTQCAERAKDLRQMVAGSRKA